LFPNYVFSFKLPGFGFPPKNKSRIRSLGMVLPVYLPPSTPYLRVLKDLARFGQKGA